MKRICKMKLGHVTKEPLWDKVNWMIDNCLEFLEKSSINL